MSTASAQLLDKFLISVVERWLLTSLVVVCLITPTGGGEKGSPPPKRWPSTSSPGTSEEEGLAHSLPPHTAGVYFGGGGTGPPPHTDREYPGGGRTGLPPRTVGVLLVPLAVESNEFVYVHT